MDLVTFLRARLDEDEATATAASVWAGERWLADGTDVREDERDRAPIARGCESDGTAAYIARHNPSRSLSQVSATRAILDDHGRYADRDDLALDQVGYRSAMRTTLRHLAAVYADHPDYRQAWKP